MFNVKECKSLVGFFERFRKIVWPCVQILIDLNELYVSNANAIKLI